MSSLTQTRLQAPEASWSVGAEVAVVGSGIAGLSTALRYVQRTEHGRVVLVTKDRLSTGSTSFAQGGIAAAMDPEDGPVAHMVDTQLAGAGLSDPYTVHVMATEGPQALRWLIGLGAEFDRGDDGTLALTREGGHRADRSPTRAATPPAPRSSAPWSPPSWPRSASRSSSTPSPSTPCTIP